MLYQAVMADISPRSLTDAAYAELRSRIVSLRIPPGGEFTEGGMAADLGLSKTPVREALARLKFEGLVLVDPQVGYRASPVTIEDTRQAFAVRALLEGEAARLAASRALPEGHLRTLDDLCRTSYVPSDPASVDRFLVANTRFHLMIGHASGNRRLERMLGVILPEMERLFRIGLLLSSRADEIVHEHYDLVTAITTCDQEQAYQVAVAQVQASERMVLAALMDSPQVSSLPIEL